MKRKNQLVALIFTLVLFVGLIGSFLRNPSDALETVTGEEGTYGERVEHFLRKDLPFREELQKWRVTLKLMSGLREIDSVFYTSERLIESLNVRDPSLGEKNLAALHETARRTESADALMFIPTASCIDRALLPPNAILFDQVGFLEYCYSDLHRSFYTVDAYEILSEAAGENLFYRTENLPTQLAGFKLYRALGERLGYTPLPLSEFSIVPLSYDCYGTLYAHWGNGGVRGDTVTAYIPTDRTVSPRVVHTAPDGILATYYTYYPLSAPVAGGDMDCILGGLSPRIDIENRSAPGRRLLVVGDRYALALLPFLSLHFDKITFAAPPLCSPGMMEALAEEEFDQVLVLSSVEGILKEDWSTALEIYCSALPLPPAEEPGHTGSGGIAVLIPSAGSPED